MSEPFDCGLRGLELLDHVLKVIDAEPEHWNQAYYAVRNTCGTSHCVAGWAAVLTGLTPFDDSETQWGFVERAEVLIPLHAAEVLELNTHERTRLFASHNSRDTLTRLRNEIAARMEAED